MRVIANENIAGSVIQGLRAAGWDVLSVKESMRGAADTEILGHAESERRIVLTQDKDFGDLAFRHHLPATCGVILLRLSGQDPSRASARILEALQSLKDWYGHFSVITEERIRMRPMPAAD